MYTCHEGWTLIRHKYLIGFPPVLPNHRLVGFFEHTVASSFSLSKGIYDKLDPVITDAMPCVCKN